MDTIFALNSSKFAPPELELSQNREQGINQQPRLDAASVQVVVKVGGQEKSGSDGKADSCIRLKQGKEGAPQSIERGFDNIVVWRRQHNHTWRASRVHSRQRSVCRASHAKMLSVITDQRSSSTFSLCQLCPLSPGSLH